MTFIAKKTKRNKEIEDHIRKLPEYRPNPLLPIPHMKLGLVLRPLIKEDEFYDKEIYTFKDKSKTRLSYYPKGSKFSENEKSPVVIFIPGFSSTMCDRYIGDTCRELWDYGGVRTVIINNPTFIEMEIDEYYDQNWFKLDHIDDLHEELLKRKSTRKANFYLLGISAGADLVQFYSGYRPENKIKVKFKGTICISGSWELEKSIKKIEKKNPIVSRVMIQGYKMLLRKNYKSPHFKNYIKKYGLKIGKESSFNDIRGLRELKNPYTMAQRDRIQSSWSWKVQKR